MDKHSKETRSYNMSMIKSSGTKPEETVRKYLFSKGLSYCKNVKTLPGKADIVLPKYKTIVFVNGCFWHGHKGCKYFVMPKTNVEFWTEKITKNIARDEITYKKLQNMGWNVIVIWECELKKDKRNNTLECLYNDILASISNSKELL